MPLLFKPLPERAISLSLWAEGKASLGYYSGAQIIRIEKFLGVTLWVSEWTFKMWIWCWCWSWFISWTLYCSNHQTFALLIKHPPPIATPAVSDFSHAFLINSQQVIWAEIGNRQPCEQWLMRTIESKGNLIALWTWFRTNKACGILCSIIFGHAAFAQWQFSPKCCWFKCHTIWKLPTELRHVQNIFDI